MLVTTQLDMQTMSTSDRAWCWVGHNYSEDEPSVEKLAARFKNPELAQQFNVAVQAAIENLKKIQEERENVIPSIIENYELLGGGDYQDDSHEEDGHDGESHGDGQEGDYQEGDYSNEDDDECDYGDYDENDEG